MSTCICATTGCSTNWDIFNEDENLLNVSYNKVSELFDGNLTFLTAHSRFLGNDSDVFACSDDENDASQYLSKGRRNNENIDFVDFVKHGDFDRICVTRIWNINTDEICRFRSMLLAESTTVVLIFSRTNSHYYMIPSCSYSPAVLRRPGSVITTKPTFLGKRTVFKTPMNEIQNRATTDDAMSETGKSRKIKKPKMDNVNREKEKKVGKASKITIASSITELYAGYKQINIKELRKHSSLLRMVNEEHVQQFVKLMQSNSFEWERTEFTVLAGATDGGRRTYQVFDGIHRLVAYERSLASSQQRILVRCHLLNQVPNLGTAQMLTAAAIQDTSFPTKMPFTTTELITLYRQIQQEVLGTSDGQIRIDEQSLEMLGRKMNKCPEKAAQLIALGPMHFQTEIIEPLLHRLKNHNFKYANLSENNPVPPTKWISAWKRQTPYGPVPDIRCSSFVKKAMFAWKKNRCGLLETMQRFHDGHIPLISLTEAIKELASKALSPIYSMLSDTKASLDMQAIKTAKRVTLRMSRPIVAKGTAGYALALTEFEELYKVESSRDLNDIYDRIGCIICTENNMEQEQRAALASKMNDSVVMITIRPSWKIKEKEDDDCMFIYKINITGTGLYQNYIPMHISSFQPDGEFVQPSTLDWSIPFIISNLQETLGPMINSDKPDVGLFGRVPDAIYEDIKEAFIIHPVILN